MEQNNLKVIISGYGRMGHMVEGVLKKRGIECVACSEDITSTPKELAAECVCIDFTVPDAFRANYRFLAENFKAVVVGTTGWDDIRQEVIDCFNECGTTMIYSSNYSIGVNILFATAEFISKMAARFGGYTASIEETHHIHKLDAPSGTAKSLASIVDSATAATTPIQSFRTGEVPGIHTLNLTGPADKLTLTHEAFSREGFAAGAVEAAVITQTISGVHDFKDLIFNTAE